MYYLERLHVLVEWLVRGNLTYGTVRYFYLSQIKWTCNILRNGGWSFEAVMIRI